MINLLDILAKTDTEQRVEWLVKGETVVEDTEETLSLQIVHFLKGHPHKNIILLVILY